MGSDLSNPEKKIMILGTKISIHIRKKIKQFKNVIKMTNIINTPKLRQITLFLVN